jgi:hypothetical protein
MLLCVNLLSSLPIHECYLSIVSEYISYAHYIGVDPVILFIQKLIKGLLSYLKFIGYLRLAGICIYQHVSDDAGEIHLESLLLSLDGIVPH